jgi:hypothetical protein
LVARKIGIFPLQAEAPLQSAAERIQLRSI